MPGSSRAPVQKLRPLVTGAAVFAIAICALMVLAVGLPSAYAQGTPSVTVTAQKAARPASTPPAGHAAAASRPARDTAKPTWAELTPAQQQALKPLAANWGTISEAQKRKWLALSKNYPTMPPSEQATLHSRMTEWVALSPQQRTQARLNFAQTQQLSPDDKKAKWQAYQALPAEEKSKLAAKAQAKPPATAAAVKPVAPQKLATVPVSPQQRPPRLAGAPDQVDHNTLLPQVAPGTVPTQSH